MKIENIVNFPFDGLFNIYKRNEKGLIEKIFYGFESDDIPEGLYDYDVLAIYPDNNAICIDVK